MATVGISRRDRQPKVVGQLVLSSDSLQVDHSQAIGYAPTIEGHLNGARYRSLIVQPGGVKQLIKMLTELSTGQLLGDPSTATPIRSGERRRGEDWSKDPEELKSPELDPPKWLISKIGMAGWEGKGQPM